MAGTFYFPLLDNCSNPLTGSQGTLRAYYPPYFTGSGASTAGTFGGPLNVLADNNGFCTFTNVVPGLYKFSYTAGNYTNPSIYKNFPPEYVYCLFPDLNGGSANGWLYWVAPTSSIFNSASLAYSMAASDARYVPIINGTASYSITASYALNGGGGVPSSTASYLTDNVGDYIQLNGPFSDNIYIQDKNNNAAVFNSLGISLTDFRNDYIELDDGIAFADAAGDSMVCGPGNGMQISDALGDNLFITGSKIISTINGGTVFSINKSSVTSTSPITASIQGTSSYALNATQLNDYSGDTVTVTPGVGVTMEDVNGNFLSLEQGGGVALQDYAGDYLTLSGAGNATLSAPTVELQSGTNAIYVESGIVLVSTPSAYFEVSTGGFGKLYVNNIITASAQISCSSNIIAKSFTGSIASSSYALTASYALNGGGSGVTPGGSYNISASWASSSLSASYLYDAAGDSITMGNGVALSDSTGANTIKILGSSNQIKLADANGDSITVGVPVVGGINLTAAGPMVLNTAGYVLQISGSPTNFKGAVMMTNLTASTVTLFNSTSFAEEIYSTINNYAEINIQNLSTGSNASADLVATNYSGSATSYFIDVGINSSTYSPAFIGGPNDAYLYVTSSTNGNLFVTNTNATGSIYLSAGSTVSTGSGLLITSQSISTTLPFTASNISASHITASNIQSLYGIQLYDPGLLKWVTVSMFSGSLVFNG